MGTHAPGEPTAGRHGLGPHVVGRRVVVRRVLRGQTGPTGGPALTDVLGVCTAWGGGVCVVDSDRGPVTIALADIVSGKPVPPRPSVRHRVGAREAHLHGHAMWADLSTEPLGEWVLRTSATATARRANSVLAVGDPGVADPVERVTEFYTAHGRRPVACVVAGEPEPFTAAGWIVEPGSDTLFQLAAVSRALRACHTVRLQRPESPATVPGAVPPCYVEDGPRVEVVLEQGGMRTASGRGALDGDWIGLAGIEVDPAHRRRGLAIRVVGALLEWGAERGASTAYLQVHEDNAPAIALYERLGFTTHHAYRYLAAPPPSA
ncbi:hypothetical protein DDE18_16470 [Nocardioides gansuensis]|uniref:N-acetyltransferase domain-containing protein n=1 Tax=Nocardioides gansuensis TaxID=2138300 RepID=A0A2T8F7A2_9ACTN|nr:hypothetical protein DDE18_16470 [Nocardioides gansuensis]